MSAALQTKGTKACKEAGKSDPQLREKKKRNWFSHRASRLAGLAFFVSLVVALTKVDLHPNLGSDPYQCPSSQGTMMCPLSAKELNSWMLLPGGSARSSNCTQHSVSVLLLVHRGIFLAFEPGCAFWVSYFYTLTHCHVLGAQGQLQNVTLPYHLNWKSPPIISWNPSLAFKTSNLGFPLTSLMMALLSLNPLLCSPIKCVGLSGLHSPLTLW